jgi:hypothetical protein
VVTSEKYDYIELHGKCYPAKALQDAVSEISGETMHHIIETSDNPYSVVMRIAAMRTDIKVRERVWQAAFEALERQGLGKTREEIMRESKGKATIASLDFSKLRRQNTPGV